MTATTANMLKNQQPLLDYIEIPGVAGKMGVTSCLGMRDENILNGSKESLLQDLGEIRDWGAILVITSHEESELHAMWGGELADHVIAHDMAWLHLPARNSRTPDALEREKWHAAVLCICNLLRQGQRVVVHCKEGIGRAGLVAVRVMLELGVSAAEAITIVRNARPGLALNPFDPEIWDGAAGSC